jgi:hypothetical protein
MNGWTVDEVASTVRSKMASMSEDDQALYAHIEDYLLLIPTGP